ncbi:MAG TPA: serine hydrolase domain-containing protein, partial [Flavobacteriales bacterium]|nr:serine hydrolase domain-containing protein [Flavobacteriales bacterium]
MKRTITTWALGLLMLPVPAQQNDKKLTAEFDKILAEYIQPNEPGATAIVTKKGKIIYHQAMGMANLEHAIPMKTETVFRIGSITKQFTAVAILQLMEQGKLNLQDEITKFIPDYPAQGRTITVEHLLTHTNGIQSFTSMKDYVQRMALDLTPAEMIDHFKREAMHFDPGTQFEYNNSGYFLLGYIIEKVSGKTYREYIEENFFKPLGMTNSLYGSNVRLVPNRAGTYSKTVAGFENASYISMTQPFGAGSIMSTVEDLSKWNAALHAGKLIKKETLQKAHTSYKLLDGSKTGYGYGWNFGYVQGSATIEHGGGINGTLTMALYLPKEDVFVAVFSNCDCGEPGAIATKLAGLAIGKPYNLKEISLENLEQYTGVYENAKGEQRVITVTENKLYSQRGKAPKYPVKPYEKDKFFFDGDVTTLEFIRNTRGEIEKVTLNSRQASED